ncbi:hypothetical protein I3214_00135 [Streptomyces sp. RB110-2]|nr:hypothetical protein [Streptomyces sp. RB110-2]
MIVALLVKYLHLPRKAAAGAKLDYAGIVTLSAAIIALTLLTSWGGVEYAWTSPQIIGLGLGTLVFLGLFVKAESTASEPIVPLRLFRDSTFTISLLGTTVCGIVFVGAVQFLALYVQVATGASPTASGFILLPMMMGLVLSSVGSSRIIMKTGTYKIFPILSMALGIVGALLLSTMDSDTPRVLTILYMVVFGFASGLSAQVFTQAAQNTARPAGHGRRLRHRDLRPLLRHLDRHLALRRRLLRTAHRRTRRPGAGRRPRRHRPQLALLGHRPRHPRGPGARRRRGRVRGLAHPGVHHRRADPRGGPGPHPAHEEPHAPLPPPRPTSRPGARRRPPPTAPPRRPDHIHPPHVTHGPSAAPPLRAAGAALPHVRGPGRASRGLQSTSSGTPRAPSIVRGGPKRSPDGSLGGSRDNDR